MMEVHIDDALGLFPNFIGYEGDAPSHINEYDNLKPLPGYDSVWNGEKPHWIEVLQKKYELSYIFISHDIKVIRSVSDYIIVLKKGEIVEEDSVQCLILENQHDWINKRYFDVLCSLDEGYTKIDNSYDVSTRQYSIFGIPTSTITISLVSGLIKILRSCISLASNPVIASNSSIASSCCWLLAIKHNPVC